MNTNGGSARRLVTAPQTDSFAETLAWSPDGRRIGYMKRNRAGITSSLESLDVETGQTAVVLSDPKITAFAWARDGRIIYAKLEEAPIETSSNLWSIQIDPRTGTTRGASHRLTAWAGFQLEYLTISSDSKRIAFTRNRPQSDVLLASIDGNGLTAPSRLTLDERIDWPAGWTPDSRAVLFYSDRNGELDIFSQVVASSEAKAVVTGPEEKRDPRVSPDGRWIIYLAWARKGGIVGFDEGHLKRMPVSGGPSEIVFSVAGYPGAARIAGDRRSALSSTGHPRFRCPQVNQAPCVLSELIRNQIVFTAFDPVKGRGGELARIDIDPALFTFWDLSPDGTIIAFGSRQEDSGKIRLLSLTGGPGRELTTGGWTHLEFVAWSADQQALFATGWSSKASPLLRIALDGETQLLYNKGRYYVESPVPSPDGRYLAFGEVTLDSNAWIIENAR